MMDGAGGGARSGGPGPGQQMKLETSSGIPLPVNVNVVPQPATSHGSVTGSVTAATRLPVGDVSSALNGPAVPPPTVPTDVTTATATSGVATSAGGSTSGVGPAAANSSPSVSTPAAAASGGGGGSGATATAAAGAPPGMPLTGKLPPVLNDGQVISKRRLQELVKDVDPNQQFDEDAEEAVLELADDFIDNLVSSSIDMASHRGGSSLTVQDVQLALESQWDMYIPGFGSSSDLRPCRKPAASDAHRQRMTLIKKALKKT